MTPFSTVVESLLMLVALVLCALWLKWRGVISSEARAIFARLVTDFALPALIVENLARRSFDFRNLLPAGIMLGSICVCLLLGWLIGRRLGLDRSKLGAFVIVAGFGSSASLGYALVRQIMGDNPGALNNALITGEFGSTLPFFVIGVAIAVHFAGQTSPAAGRWTASLLFFRSPIFLALVVGLALSFLRLPETNPVVGFLYRVLGIIGGSLETTVAIAIALMLKPIRVREFLPLILVIAGIKLIVEPLLAFAGAHAFGLTQVQVIVLVIEAGMPSGTIATVVAARYGLDGALASSITIATYVLCLVTLPLIFWLTIW